MVIAFISRVSIFLFSYFFNEAARVRDRCDKHETKRRKSNMKKGCRRSWNVGVGLVLYAIQSNMTYEREDGLEGRSSICQQFHGKSSRKFSASGRRASPPT